MGIWHRRSSSSGKSPPSALAIFVEQIVERPGQRAACHLKVAEYQGFRAALSARLPGHGDPDSGLVELLAGRLVGVCPTCQMRLSAEYLEWLFAASLGLPAQRSKKAARFARGQCVNERCPSTDILLHWEPL